MKAEATIREKYDVAEQEFQSAERRLQELREEENALAGQLEELRSQRAQAVRQGNHAAIDSFEAESVRVSRQAERARMLVVDAEAAVQPLAQSVASLGVELRQQVEAQELAAMRDRGVARARAFCETFRQQSRELAFIAREQMDLRARSNQAANEVAAIFDELALEIGNYWTLPGVDPIRTFTLRAMLPKGESLPASAPITTQPEPQSARLISHPRPPMAALSGPRT